MFTFVLIIALIAAVAYTLKTGTKVIKNNEALVVERLGKYHKTLLTGTRVIIPFLDTTKKIDWVELGKIIETDRVPLAETLFAFPHESALTSDNIELAVHVQLYVQITDPVKACYNTGNLPVALHNLMQTLLINMVRKMSLDNLLRGRGPFTLELQKAIEQKSSAWGIKINRVELPDIIPPRHVVEEMQRVLDAEKTQHRLKAQNTQI